MKIIRLIDLDDHTPTDVEEFRRNGIHVLGYRHLEVFLYDDEVLTSLCDWAGQPAKAADLIAAKATAVAAVKAAGHPADDIKKAAGEIYNAAKKMLSLTQVGNDAPAFARNTLAKLIKPRMAVYSKLHADIFGP